LGAGYSPEDFAEELWNTYFGGRDAKYPRPFGDVNLDGINLDVQNVDYDYSSVVEILAAKSKDQEFVVSVMTNNDVNTSSASVLDVNSSVVLVRYASEDLSNDTFFEENIKSWFTFANDHQSSLQVLVPRFTTNMIHIERRVKSLRDLDLFNGIAFDEVEPKYLPFGTARATNTLLKMNHTSD